MSGIMKCRLVAASVLLVTLAALPGCKRNVKITKENYEKIQFNFSTLLLLCHNEMTLENESCYGKKTRMAAG